MMTLSEREKLYAALIGGCLLIGVLYFGWSYVAGEFNSRQQRITSLKKDLSERKLRKVKADQAVRELHEYRARALPETPDVARTVYQGWLLSQLAAVKLEDQSVTAGATRSLQRLGYELSFTAKGRGTLPQIVELLDRVQRPDYLHRVERLTVKPVLNSKWFDIAITLEALALEKSDATTAMPEVTTSRLSLASLADYEAVICNRNLFGPKNNPPALRAPSSQTATINKEFTYTLEAKDPDALDKVSYRLEQSPSGVSLDPLSGKLRWQPKEKGKFEFDVVVKDDGLPTKETAVKLVVNVVDPPPPPIKRPDPPPPPKKLEFDHAKYTILAGVTEVNGEREVWLLNRPKGEMLKLHVGDKFDIGSIQGTIESIGDEDFIFLVGTVPHRLYKGETLEEALIWDGN